VDPRAILARKLAEPGMIARIQAIFAGDFTTSGKSLPGGVPGEQGCFSMPCP
jgi:hypothetical protein